MEILTREEIVENFFNEHREELIKTVNKGSKYYTITPLMNLANLVSLFQ